jgi:diacylglycerol kinase (ATP)
MDKISRIPYDTAFVVNPAAGGGNSGRIWPRIEAVLNRSGQHFLSYMTGARGEATELATRAVENGAEMVVAVGGDGTVKEVVNGIDIGKTIMGVIPAGTGNGFRRSVGIPGQWERALDGLGQWPPRRIDLGEVNGTYFLNVVGIGFDAAVAEMASEKYKMIKGYTAYLVAFFQELVTFDHFDVTVESDGLNLKEDHTLLTVVANGKFYGGSFSIAPQAIIDDGKLELILVRKLSSPQTTILAVQALAKKHLESSAVITRSGTNFKITADHPVPVHIDGEVTGSLPALITIKPSALQILAPEAKN